MDHRWRPIVDESALNSIAGSRLGSEVGGRGPPTRGGLTSHGSSAGPYGQPGISTRPPVGHVNRQDSNRTSGQESDYFRRPSMRRAMSITDGSQSSIGQSQNRMVARTETGRTMTSGQYGSSRPTGGNTTTSVSRRESDLSHNQSLKTDQSQTTNTQLRNNATVSRNTSMSSASRTVTNVIIRFFVYLFSIKQLEKQ